MVASATAMQQLLPRVLILRFRRLVAHLSKTPRLPFQTRRLLLGDILPPRQINLVLRSYPARYQWPSGELSPIERPPLLSPLSEALPDRVRDPFGLIGVNESKHQQMSRQQLPLPFRQL